LQGLLQQFFYRRKINKRRKLRLLSIILLLSVLVSTEVFWSMRQTGIAMAGTASCGVTEHSHTDECEADCGYEEHTHSLSCYSNEGADVETKAMWELTVSGVPYTEDYAADLVAVAKTQLGYKESEANFQTDEYGDRNGYTRYGAWYGNPYGKWSSMFVAFCLYYAGAPIGVIPMQAGAESARAAWEDIGYYEAASYHTVSVGDLIFFDTDGDLSADLMGIVSRVSGNAVSVIYGDVNDRVEEASYQLSDGSILGYAGTGNVPSYLEANGTLRVQRSVSLPAYTNNSLSVLSSDSQIIKHGGQNAAGDGTVVSKTIAGTGIENIFDITLTVETQQKIEMVYEEPDMAVVIVMDISNTMNAAFGDTSRYVAAMEAAEDFIYHFADAAGSVSEIGYVAFNTSAHKIFDLQNCSNEAQAAALIEEMKSDTGKIINASNYAESKTRYTNVEAGLKMGWDMIKNSSQEHKYIIFLSDGFPTTYLKNHNGTDYVGYEPYSSSGKIGNDGVFYDSVTKYYNEYGTSYSDKAAIYARQMATSIKNAGGTIFSIGVDIGGQTIDGHDGRVGLSVIDRTGTNYEIGSASSAQAYKDWLKNKIGSGYYYDSTNTAGLKDAYEKIFTEIQRVRHEESKAEWIACDPLPIMEDSYFKTVEFIGFYDKNSNFIPLSATNTLTGTHTNGAENSAVFNVSADQIDWDLKNSGFTETKSSGISVYKYQLVYRVRLRNEDTEFNEHTEYYTNDVTTLSYRLIESVNGEEIISETKTLNFPLPSVEGYLGELSFTKVDPHGSSIAGAEFTLSHDTTRCNVCHGDGTAAQTIPVYTATSDADGTVTFTRIPSGHVYTMTETVVPAGYLDTGRLYRVTVAYDETTVNVSSSLGEAIEWNGTVLNNLPYDLPSTGGSGTRYYTVIGLTLISVSIFCLVVLHRRRRLSE